MRTRASREHDKLGYKLSIERTELFKNSKIVNVLTMLQITELVLGYLKKLKFSI